MATHSHSGPTDPPRWEVDPYGIAISNIVNALERAEVHSGAMSEGEHDTLGMMEMIIRQRDPGAWETVRRFQKVGPKAR